MTVAEVKSYLSHLEGLSTLPVLNGKILSIVKDENTSEKDLVEVISHDPALAERVIQVANSALLGHSGQLRDIRQAILLLGFDKIKSIAVGMKVLDLIPHHHSFDIKNLWIHCYEVALIASEVSEYVTMTSPEESFLAGLLHDLGRILFCKIDQERFFQIGTTEEMFEKELDLFGCTHAEAGAWLAEAAGLPQEIITVARFHHHPSEAREFRDSVAIISMAEALSRMFDPRIEDDGIWTEEHNALLLELGIDHDQLILMGQQLVLSRKEAERFFNPETVRTSDIRPLVRPV
jgi:putative nucleotidyltransferase with HDIG domain